LLCSNRPLLPARLHHAGKFALVRQLTEADSAETELPQIGARTPAPLTPVVLLHAVARRSLRLRNHGFLRQCVSPYVLNGMPSSCSSRLPSRSVPALVTMVTCSPRTRSILS